MKIQDLREKLKKCSNEDVIKIASELYKMVPKSKKESDADPMIEAVISGESPSEASKKKVVADFETLKNEIVDFLDKVDDNLYIEPNRTVPKSKRSKWRFEVKNFVKMINTIPEDNENAAEAARLLRELYKRLAYGCGYYIFPSEDPFQSVGIRQPDFYKMLTERTFATGYTDENLKNMLEDAVTVDIDRNSLYIEMEAVYVKSLPSSDLKYKAAELIKDYVLRYEEKLKTKMMSSDEYHLKHIIRELCETMLLIGIALCEPDDAVNYYWKHAGEKNKEITLYCILRTISFYGDDNLWIKVYEDGLKKKIQPRDVLVKQYNELKAQE